MSEDESRGRYVGTETDDGDIRIYDSENEDAWVQSDETVDVAWQT